MSQSEEPLPIYTLRDYTPSLESQNSIKYQKNTPILIDFGTSNVRVGYSNSTDNFLSYPTLISKYRERKQNKTLTFVGNDVFLDPSVKNQAKSPFDGSFVTNFDLVEQILDYSFHKIGVKSLESNPIVISEKPAQTLIQRRSFYELFYELYGVKKLSFGIDGLFSFYQNNGSNGVVINSGHESTHVIPVINGKGLISESKRLNWGGHQASNYLNSSLQLKYPYFPSKINYNQTENLVRDYCYVSPKYQEELEQYLTSDNLEKENIVIEAPFVEIEKQVKSEEELRKQAEKRKESGRRLQEQAQQKRLEKLIQKEQEFEYYTSLLEKIKKMNKKQQQSTFKQEGFDNEEDFNKHLAGLDKALTKARTKDIGEDQSVEEPSFPLVDVADDQLDEDSLKEKRKQKLMKANYEARQRAKQAKIEEEKKIELEQLKDKEWRESDLKSWIHDRRTKLKVIIQKRKDRAKLKEQLNDRKSLAAQQRMKNIASLASEDSRSSNATNKRKRTTIDNDPNDTFGANDDDWSIYRDISKDDPDEEELLEEEEQTLLKLEKDLLEFDPSFTEEDTLEAQYDYRKSILHLYLRGPRPFNSENSHEQHQIHLNVERIKVPEILFQPSIVGLDQAGIVEIGENLLLNTLSTGQRKDVAGDIFLTGGQALFNGFEERVYNEYRQFLPVDVNLKVRTAQDPLNDSWRGMAKWASSGDAQYLTKAEYEEYGPDYIKEHNLGNYNVVAE